MRHISVRVDDELYQKVKEEADNDGFKVADYVRRKLRQIASNHGLLAAGIDESAAALLRQLEAKDNQLSRRDDQIDALTQQNDHLTQLLAVQTKNNASLTGRLQAIEDMRHRPWWRRLFRRGAFR